MPTPDFVLRSWETGIDFETDGEPDEGGIALLQPPDTSKLNLRVGHEWRTFSREQAAWLANVLMDWANGKGLKP